ncbi:ATP-binding cassette domain-containing protein [Mycoplasmatota bacterium]|nr:ATP-binding cassette domain-containing protein [Mycoplasmatota bacterium]
MKKTLVVKTDNLTKSYSSIEAVYQCNISIAKGSIYGLLGENGAGKTTIFKLLTGLLIPTMGKAEVLGMDITKCRSDILKNIGSIIEVPVFYEHLSAVKNLEIHLAYMGVSGLEINSVLEMVGLSNTNNQPVSQFSLGMRQRLGIARALIHKPKLLILDEPVNGLDPTGIREMRKLFLKLKQEENMTILISSHNLSEVEHVADTIGIIAKGKIIEEVTLSEVIQKFPNGLEDYFFNILKGDNKRD